MSDLFSTPWHRQTMVAFDTETTSVDVDTARIVTATVAIIRPGQEPEIRSWLIDPGVEIPDEAAAVHGITTEKARAEGQEPRPALVEIAEALSWAARECVPVIAYNAAYDVTVLHRELLRHNLNTSWLPQLLVVDPFVLDKQVDKYRKGKRTLTAACEHYGVRLDGAHDATADALGAARVAWCLAERYPELQVPLRDLHVSQVVWKAQQAESFGQYLVRQGKTDDVSRQWPLKSLPANWQAVA